MDEQPDGGTGNISRQYSTLHYNVQ